jgi:hypothetical protein
MTVNLIEAIENNLSLDKLQKVDPNTQEPKEQTHTLAQAAIPTVLLGLYKYANTDIGAEEIMRGSNSTNWFDAFFAGNKSQAIQKVASYSGDDDKNVETQREHIANEAVKIIREHAPSNASPSQAKSYITENRSEILKRLPAELQIGDLLNDDTLDDRTNKMEGPMSNHMHFFEKLFSGSTTEDKDVKKTD